jgi:acyl dehydratase
MADKSKIGKVYPEISWEVERGKIREMAAAIGDGNPIYKDQAAAAKEGYQDIPITPTYLTVPAMGSGNMLTLVGDLGINVAMVLHGEEEYEFLGDIYPGDVLTGRCRVVDVEEKTTKKGSKMDLVTTEVLYTNQRGEAVAKARTVIVERK